MKSYENKPDEINEASSKDAEVSAVTEIKENSNSTTDTIDSSDAPVDEQKAGLDETLTEVSNGKKENISDEITKEASDDELEEMSGKSSRKVSDEVLEEMAEESSEEVSDEQSVEKKSAWARFWPPTREQWVVGIAFGSVVLLALILRLWDLGEKPLHHDESLHAYYSYQLMLSTMDNWLGCLRTAAQGCYQYDPLLHGPFQFHAIALVYKISQLFGVPDQGANEITARLVAVTLGTAVVFLPFFLRRQLGTVGAWLASLLLAISPSMVYYSRFSRGDIYMACFTLLLVVATAHYLRTRRLSWLVTGVVAFILSFATKEATFLTIAVFGCFFAGLIVWELGIVIPLQKRRQKAEEEVDTLVDGEPVEAQVEDTPRVTQTWVLPLMGIFGAVLAVFGLIFFQILHSMSAFIASSNANKVIADGIVEEIKRWTVYGISLFGILLAGLVIFILYREYRGILPSQERRGLARRVNPERQPLLDSIVTMPWTHWFFGFVVGWTVFLILFTSLFTNIPKGIADGIWQGLYYWLGQHEEARGGQPWYYYLMLIPLYEQIGLLFGLVGAVYSLFRPTIFRLFLIFWFVGNFAIYSWAGEKMPWLMIHTTMPLLLLAAVGLQPIIKRVISLIKAFWALVSRRSSEAENRPHLSIKDATIAGLGLLVALATLAPTLQNMVQPVYVHPAGAQYEMMIYVQTTPHVKTIMEKVAEIDREYYGGKREIPIVVTPEATWPFAWYVRNYKNACLAKPENCPLPIDQYAVIISDDSTDLPQIRALYGDQYNISEYEMRAQGNQGYMPCDLQPQGGCAPRVYTGVTPLTWLSYGNDTERIGQYDVGLIAQNVWKWWWTREPFGGIDRGAGMSMLVKKEYDR